MESHIDVPGTPGYEAWTAELRAQGRPGEADARDAAAAAASAHDPGPVPGPEPDGGWSTLVVHCAPDFAGPLRPLNGAAQRYDRNRAMLTLAGAALLRRAFLPRPGDEASPEDWRAGTERLEAVNWFVSADLAQLVQFTAPTPLIDAVQAVAEARDGMSVAVRADHPRMPGWVMSA